jgi:AcrR family transcriptional regulator
VTLVVRLARGAEALPRLVDHDERRQQIVHAAFEIIGETGFKGLSLRKVAQRLGGSSTYVTHYYASKDALMEDAAHQLIESWNTRVTEIEQGLEDPVDRLRRFLYWLLPLDATSFNEERARIILLAESDEIGFAPSMFEAFNDRMMRFLDEHLLQIVEESDVGQSAQILRVITNGICLSALERPNAWPAESQTRVVDLALELLGVQPDIERSAPIKLKRASKHAMASD